MDMSSFKAGVLGCMKMEYFHAEILPSKGTKGYPEAAPLFLMTGE